MMRKRPHGVTVIVMYKCFEQTKVKRRVNASSLHAVVSLGKTLNPKLPRRLKCVNGLIEQTAPDGQVRSLLSMYESV